MADWTHDKLLVDLREQLEDPEWVIFQECRMGATYSTSHLAIPDIVAIRKSYGQRKETRIYEVKATTADLRSDVGENKWEKYLKFCDRLFFAVGPDVEWERAIKHYPVGVLQRGATGWRKVRNAPPTVKKRKPWAEDVWLSMIFSHIPQVKKNQDAFDSFMKEREAILSGELDKLRIWATGELKKKADELYEREQKVKLVEESSEQLAYQKILKFLLPDTHAYRGYRDPLRDVVDQLFVDSVVDAVRKTVNKNFEKLVAAAEAANVEVPKKIVRECRNCGSDTRSEDEKYCDSCKEANR